MRTGTSFYYPDRRRTSEEQPTCHGTRLEISRSWLEVYRISWRPRIFDRVRGAAFLPGAVPQQELESAVAAAAVTALERRPPLRQDDQGRRLSPTRVELSTCAKLRAHWTSPAWSRRCTPRERFTISLGHRITKNPATPLRFSGLVGERVRDAP